ncbi:MAG: polysaccharide deacetylase family protein, partial [Deltaproteobacteria bacterium]
VARGGERSGRRHRKLDEAKLLHREEYSAPVFALTFDDGPGPSTAELLDVLGAAGVRSTFFLLGRNVEEAPWCGDPARARGLAERAAREGHALGNHTWSHLRPDRWRELAADVRRGEDVVRSLRTGHVRFRLPYGILRVSEPFIGSIGEQMDPRLAVIASLGVLHQHWTSDFGDWALGADDGPALAARMAAHVQDCESAGLDAVLDLHDSGTGSSFGYDRPATVAGTRLFLEEAQRRGWKSFVLP